MSHYPIMDSQRSLPSGLEASHRSDSGRVRFSTQTHSQPVNPMERWSNSGDDPFVPKATLPHESFPRPQKFPAPGGHAQGPVFPQFQQWRNPQPSECDTINGGVCPSDSGYASMPGPHLDTASICSYPVADRSHDVRSITNQVSDLNVIQGVGSGLSQAQEPYWDMMPPENNVRGSFHCPFSGCKKPVCRTRSELNKHRQRHEKLHKCQVRGCKRATEGFGTTNDLDRHMKTVHGAGGTRYKCTHGSCCDKDKLWPRADNFRAHLERAHRISVSIDNLEAYKYIEPSEPPQPSPCLVFGSGSNFDAAMTDDIPSDIMDGMSPDKTASDDGLMLEDDSHYAIDSNFTAACGPPDARSQEAQEDLQMEDSISINEFEHETSEASQSSLPPAVFALSCQDSESTIQGSKDEPQAQVAIQGDGQFVGSSSQPTSHVERVPSEEHGSTPQKDSQPNTRSLSEREEEPSDSSAGMSGSSSSPISDIQDTSSSTPSKDSEISLEDISQNDDEVRRLFERLQGTGKLTKVLETLGYVQAKPAPQTSDDTDSTHTSPANSLSEGKIRCTEYYCFKTFKRRCELTKHLKRHQKPYGCTFGKCRKRFGSKNDWKRHENSQHFQLEVWKCDFQSPGSADGEYCGKFTICRDKFKAHLKDGHNLGEDEVERMLESCRIGRSCEGAFWCGFCRKRVALQKKGREGWDERFNHIDDHFVGRAGPQRDINEWEAIDHSRASLDDPACDSDAGKGGVVPCSRKRGRPDETHYGSSHDNNVPKRVRRDRVDQVIKRPYSVVITCCNCRQFQGAEKMHDRCPNDDHEFSNCETCSREAVEHRE